MNDFPRAFMHALKKQRTIPGIQSVQHRFSFFRPLDWAIVGTLLIVIGLSVATTLAAVSLALTVETPARGGTYTEGVVGSPRFINPVLAISETDQDLTRLVFSGLMKKLPDGTLEPDLAESYSISSDEKTYTFTLRPDAKFQDGTFVTAEDVLYTIRAAQNPDIKSPQRAEWEGVDVTSTDTRTVVFTLDEPFAPFLDNLTLGIMPKHLWQNVTAEQYPFTTLNQDPVGSGPYMVDGKSQNGSGIPTEYRLKAFTGGVRTPYIDRFTMRFYSNDDELKNAFNRGEVSAANSINPSALSGSPAVREAVFGRVFGVFFNQSQNPVFADDVVRYALDLAVDKKAVIDTVLSGYGSAIDGPLPPPDTNTEDASSTANAARAAEVLAKDGWKAGSDGVLAKTSTVKGKKQTQKLSFTLATTNDPELKQAADMVAANWKAIGADVTVQFFEQNDLSLQIIRPRKYDALFFGEVVGDDPDLFAFWHSSQRIDPGLNIALYANADVDKKLSAARTETDPDLRRAKIQSAADEIASETAAVFVYAPHFVYVTPKDAAGIVFGTIASPADRFDAVDQWYLKTDRVWPVFTTSLDALFNSFKS